jgi:putative hydrolase of the HAD superfamily
MIKTVIFDSDGMLTHGPRFSEHYSKEHGISIDEMTPFFVGPFKDCLVGKADLKEELQKGWLEKWKWPGTTDELLDYWFSVGDHLDQNVFASVEKLRDSGLICVLATNQERYRTDYLSDTFGYTDAFDKVFSSAYTGHKKPSSEFFDEIMTYLRIKDPSIQKANVLFWDDDNENVAGAHTYGFMTRLFVDNARYTDEMRALELL